MTDEPSDVVGTLPACCAPGVPVLVSPTSLDPPETEPPSEFTPEPFDRISDQRPTVSFRHSGWDAVRRKVFDSLRRTEQPQHRLYEFLHCGSHAYILKSLDEPPRYKLAGSCCHDRFCLPCANERSRAIALNVSEATEGKTLRFLTVTVKCSGESLANRVDHLYDSFQKLRRRLFWQHKVTGGMAFLEVKWSEATQRWHPHFHILIEGKYLPYTQLKKYWYQVTGDSHILDIRLVRDHAMATAYITKYASKPFNKTFVHIPDRLDEAVTTLKGRKLVLTFGAWRGLLVARTISNEAWVHAGTLEETMYNASRGEDNAIMILRSLTNLNLTPLLIDFPLKEPPPKKAVPLLEQLTMFGVWNEDGTWSHFE